MSAASKEPLKCKCCGFKATAEELNHQGICVDCIQGRHQKDCSKEIQQLALGEQLGQPAPAPAEAPAPARAPVAAEVVATTGPKAVEKQAEKPKTKLDSVRGFLERMAGNMAAVLPRHMTVEKMIKVALVNCAKTPLLLDCTPQSLAGAIMQASELGIEPGGALGHGWLVPYRNKKGVLEVQFIPGYRGLIYLARNSGEISQIGAWPVFKGEAFEYTNTDQGQKLSHVPKWDADRSPANLTHVYMIARLKGEDLPQIEIMTKAEVDAVRARSKAKDNGPWVSDYVEMARKSVVKRGAKYLPLSPEKAEKFHRAIEISNRSERDELDLDMLPEGPDDSAEEAVDLPARQTQTPATATAQAPAPEA